MSEFFVYITNDLSRRMGEHKPGAIPGFTKRYKVDQLVYCEPYTSIEEARSREHILKRWRRDWKFKLIEARNPDWKDLAPDIA